MRGCLWTMLMLMLMVMMMKMVVVVGAVKIDKGEGINYSQLIKIDMNKATTTCLQKYVTKMLNEV